MYPQNTSQIFEFLGFEFFKDFEVGAGTPLRIAWLSITQQPTEQAVIDAGNDLTTVNGQVFSEWYAENGGDPVATLRRKAREALDKQNAETEALIRALAFVVLDEINILRAQHSLADRTPAQLRTAIKAKITAGDADT